MIRRVNFYGGPGTGKSTMATHIFSKLKMAGRSVEFAHEFVKLWAYEGRVISIEDQWTIFNEQRRVEEIPLHAGVDFTISDSPLPLVCVYSKRTVSKADQVKMFLEAQQHESDYPSLNIYLERNPFKKYSNKGRWQTEEEAKAIDGEIRETLRDFNLPFVVIGAQNYDEVLAFVESETK